MPSICRFFGIVIYIYHGDHVPPHFHARYAGKEALYEIETLRIYRGNLPRRAHSLVIEWADMHRAELMDNWQRARHHEPLQRIEPLE
jgi:hypothetical protein